MVSDCQRLGTAKLSGPASGVQASTKATPAITQQAAADEATARQKARTWTAELSSALAQAVTTASAIPGANQHSDRGRVSPSQSAPAG